MSPDGVRVALDLFEIGDRMKRLQLRRTLSEEKAVIAALTEWRRRRPGAESGDAPGRSSTRFGALPE